MITDSQIADIQRLSPVERESEPFKGHIASLSQARREIIVRLAKEDCPACGGTGRRKEGTASEADDDLQACEHCGKAFDIETMTMMSDCWICDGCYAEWKKGFDACDHDWEPKDDEFGDPGQYCTKCAGFVTNDTFPLLFGRAPPPPPAG